MQGEGSRVQGRVGFGGWSRACREKVVGCRVEC